MAKKTTHHIVPYGFLFLVGLVLSYSFGSVRTGKIDSRLLALSGVVIFLIFSVVFLEILSSSLRQAMIARRLGIGRAAALQYLVRIFGYLAILFTALSRVGVPVGHLLLGSAVLGIILGVAAQQALANFFASVVLIVAHPFSVGDDLILVSGALGGSYEGIITDIGLTHTRLTQDDGVVVALPNSTLLAGAAIKPRTRKDLDEK